MNKQSFHAGSRSWFWITMLTVFPLVVYGQLINVIRITGNTAEISEGTGGGIRKGDTVTISRMIGNAWSEIATAEVVQADYSKATVQIPTGAPMVKLGDKVEKVQTPPLSKKKKDVPAKSSDKRPSPTVQKKSVRQPVKSPSTASRQSSRTARSRTVEPSYQSEKRVYLGPQIGAFIPVGDMADKFESSFGYGGMLGAQFRKNLDVCLHFFFAAKKNEWSFWNLQLLGRRYLNQNVLFDFGYGIAYPEFIKFGGGGNIQLGLCLGLTYSAPLSKSMWFELGALYQYYPNFSEKAGQFFTLQGRLLL